MYVSAPQPTPLWKQAATPPRKLCCLPPTGAPLGGAFHAKLGVAALLLIVILALNMVVARAKAKGVPPPAWLPVLGMTTPVLTMLAVVLAVIVFN